MDNDADPDILASGNGDPDVYWYENNSGKSKHWVKHRIQGGTGRKLMAHPADLNNDGNIDVVTMSWGANNVKWFRNNSCINGDDWEEFELNADFNRAWPVSSCDIE